VFQQLQTLPWNFALYLPRREEWTLDSLSAVLDPNDCEDDADEPQFAIDHELRYALTIQDIQSIARNVSQQKPNATEHDFLCAFKFYFDKDSFMDF
jgi:hypothetical protein